MTQPSFDKWVDRDWLTSGDSGWEPAANTPLPPLPDDVVELTCARYVEAYEWLSSRSIADWLV